MEILNEYHKSLNLFDIETRPELISCNATIIGAQIDQKQYNPSIYFNCEGEIFIWFQGNISTGK